MNDEDGYYKNQLHNLFTQFGKDIGLGRVIPFETNIILLVWVWRWGDILDNNCNHKLVHLDTKKKWASNGYNNKYSRIDNFYCENCGEIITKNKTDYCREEPDWY